MLKFVNPFLIMDADTSNAIQELIRTPMKEQQTALLGTAAANAEELISTKLRENNTEIRDTHDREMERGATHNDHNFTNNINKNNHSFCKQINDLWERTDRALQENNPEKARGYAQQGKTLTKKRLKLLRIADTDGWDTALAYVSDDLASNSDDEKRLKAARRAAQTKRQSGKRRDRTSFYDSEKRNERSSNRPEGDYTWRSKNFRPKPKSDAKICWSCGKFSHFSSSCKTKFGASH